MKIGYKELNRGVNTGHMTIGAATETASISYDGTLLPVGSGANPQLRYLKDKGKDKSDIAIQSGQGKIFNGTSQYIATGATPNDTKGTFGIQFTYKSVANKVIAGMNFNDNRCYMGVNNSGKIGVGFGNTNYDVLFSTINPVVDRMYDGAFRYNETTYWFFIDGELQKTGDVTGLASFIGTTFFIGAMNSGGTASHHYNGIIGRTFYYDELLSDDQIMKLYQYPEAIKAYNGAIVPDIGNEANCRMFLPMTESSGSNVYNLAVPYGNNIVVNGEFTSNTSSWYQASDATLAVNNGELVVTTAAGDAAGGASQTINTVAGKTYMVSVDTYSPAGAGMALKISSFGGSWDLFSGSYVAYATKTRISAVFTAVNQSITLSLYGGNMDGKQVFWDNVTLKEVSAMPMVNFATTMNTNAKQLGYGTQCIAFKRDSLGIITGLANAMGFDNQVSVKGVDSQWVPNMSEDFVVSVVQEFVNDGSAHGSGFATGTDPRMMVGESSGSKGVEYIGTSTMAESTTRGEQYSNVVIEKIGNVYTLVVNGDAAGQVIKDMAQDTRTWWFGAVNGSSSFNMKSMLGSAKVWKGAQTVKYNRAKNWANAQKIIAKLQGA